MQHLDIGCERVQRRARARAGLLWDDDSVDCCMFVYCIAEELVMPCGMEGTVRYYYASVVLEGLSRG